jgi:hypothetical protein
MAIHEVTESVLRQFVGAAMGNIFKGLSGLANLDEKREKFTQETVKQLRDKYNNYNAVIVHTEHETWGAFVHEHVEMPIGFLDKTMGYEIYLSRFGDFFGLELRGDGGYINWAYNGYFTRDGNKLLALSPYSPSPAGLLPGQSLYPGKSLPSPVQRHTLFLQTDGNVSLYNNSSQLVWATNTSGIQPRDFTMQPDGNLVLYDVAGNPKWNSNTSGNPGAFFRVQDDGNLVVYRKTETADNALWQSGTFGR